jgi:hypothetical protein
MNFTFTTTLANGVRDVTTRVEDLPKRLWQNAGDRLVVSNNIDLTADDLIFENGDAFEEWWDTTCRSQQWKDKADRAGALEKPVAALIESLKPLAGTTPYVCGYSTADGLKVFTAEEMADLSKSDPNSMKIIKDALAAICLPKFDEKVTVTDSPVEQGQGVSSPINPSHYQAYVADEVIELQWLETMCRMQRYREHPERFIGAVELQIRKYMDRCGGKDEETQEMLKALWYMKFLCAYMLNGCKPVLVKNIDTILLSGK